MTNQGVNDHEKLDLFRSRHNDQMKRLQTQTNTAGQESKSKQINLYTQRLSQTTTCHLYFSWRDRKVTKEAHPALRQSLPHRFSYARSMST